MRLLGAVLAGGRSSRFGSDKAQALIEGRPLIDHAIAALLPQVTALVIVGRDWPGVEGIADAPRPGLGPLGGLCGALGHAAAHGFDAVLMAPCDTIGLPADLAARLAPGPAVAVGQPCIGRWPAALAPALFDWLHGDSSRSMRVWVQACGAREIDCGALRNINHPSDIE